MGQRCYQGLPHWEAVHFMRLLLEASRIPSPAPALFLLRSSKSHSVPFCSPLLLSPESYLAFWVHCAPEGSLSLNRGCHGGEQLWQG